MRWKTVGRIAKVVAYAVVPGAAGYLAYKHVIRPWLDNRATKVKEDTASSSGDHPPAEEHAVHREDPSGS